MITITSRGVEIRVRPDFVPLRMTAELANIDIQGFILTEFTIEVPIEGESFFFVAQPACSDALSRLILEDNNVREQLAHALQLRQ